MNQVTEPTATEEVPVIVRPNLAAVRKAVRAAGLRPKFDMEVARRPGKRLVVSFRPLTKLEREELNIKLDELVPFGISRTFDGVNFTVTVQLPRR